MINNILIKMKGEKMLKEILKLKVGEIDENDLKQIFDMATADIKFNRLGFSKKTSLDDLIELLSRCYEAYEKS
ncbi:hypothetical protein CLPU_1c03640 [Gottschalkia purinilytica]|uniref:Uncharacterized protein n=1 Tax=Gottschalkia purinilytica TaxID=1503 RepID=A0A0L0WFF5_GOTPU|nr:hypothetical protein CLPU_1c03640 [Gottschalkia purinilytica]